MVKKRDELEGFAMEPAHATRSGSGNRALPRVVPIMHGKVLAVYPDDATVDAMKNEGWSTVKIGFKKNDAGEFVELALVKSDDETGINVRFYDKQRVNIHVTVKHHGVAEAKPGAGACDVRRVGDAFVFSILDQISISPVEEQRDQ
jgi:hypothetical protein